MLRRALASIAGWWKWLWATPPPRYRLLYVEGDELPPILPDTTLVVAREGNSLWTCGMVCPCGCGRRLEMMLLAEVRPNWRLANGRCGPSLHPSVWAADGCRSHFWLRDGLVHWCLD